MTYEFKNLLCVCDKQELQGKTGLWTAQYEDTDLLFWCAVLCSVTEEHSQEFLASL